MVHLMGQTGQKVARQWCVQLGATVRAATLAGHSSSACRQPPTGLLPSRY